MPEVVEAVYEGCLEWEEALTRGSVGSAGVDLRSREDVVIGPGEVRLVGTGVRLAVPRGWAGFVFARSGLAVRGLCLANGVGVVDSDYRGEVKVALRNCSKEEMFVGEHERVAQLVVMPYWNKEIMFVEELSETERGEGGFGSTGSL